VQYVNGQMSVYIASRFIAIATFVKIGRRHSETDEVRTKLIRPTLYDVPVYAPFTQIIPRL
jgi:hypothetical protein